MLTEFWRWLSGADIDDDFYPDHIWVVVEDRAEGSVLCSGHFSHAAAWLECRNRQTWNPDIRLHIEEVEVR